MKTIWFFLLLCLSNLSFSKNDEDLKRVLGPYYNTFVNSWNLNVNELSFNPTFPKTYLNSEQKLTNEINRYYFDGLQSQLVRNERLPAQVFQEKSQFLNYKAPVALSVIAFKRGEFLKRCREVVARAIKAKVKAVSLIWPIHFSGIGLEKILSPKYGEDWLYHYEWAPELSELDQCVSIISDTEIDINFVPQLESVHTMIASKGGDEKFWRFYSGVPLDDHYFENSMLPYLKILENYSKKLRQRKLYITVAAELDPLVFIYSEQILSFIKSSRMRLKKSDLAPHYLLKTNGDFYHSYQIAKKRGVNCIKLKQMIEQIDGLSPSFYLDKGHLVLNDRKQVDLEKSYSKYLGGFQKQLHKFCPKQDFDLKKDKHIGEFGTKVNKEKIVEVLNKKQDFVFINLWNYGDWELF